MDEHTELLMLRAETQALRTTNRSLEEAYQHRRELYAELERELFKLKGDQAELEGRIEAHRRSTAEMQIAWRETEAERLQYSAEVGYLRADLEIALTEWKAWHDAWAECPGNGSATDTTSQDIQTIRERRKL